MAWGVQRRPPLPHPERGEARRGHGEGKGEREGGPAHPGRAHAARAARRASAPARLARGVIEPGRHGAAAERPTRGLLATALPCPAGAIRRKQPTPRSASTLNGGTPANPRRRNPPRPGPRAAATTRFGSDAPARAYIMKNSAPPSSFSSSPACISGAKRPRPSKPPSRVGAGLRRQGRTTPTRTHTRPVRPV